MPKLSSSPQKAPQASVTTPQVAQKPLIGDLRALKEFLLWCKAEGVRKVDVAGASIEFGPHAFELPQSVTAQETKSPEQLKEDREKEEAELLYWSANN